MRWREIVVFALYLVGAVIFTYPLARNLRTATTDHYDPLLDAWALSWVAHQLPRDPVHLFDANRFYPETGTLAFTDPMIGLAIVVAPVEWLFGESLLTLDVAMLFSLALSGYGAYQLGWYLTGSRAAGAVAGSVFAFDAYRLNQLGHVQLQTAGYIPPLQSAISYKVDAFGYDRLVPWNRGSLHKARGHFVGWRGVMTNSNLDICRLVQRACRAEG